MTENQQPRSVSPADCGGALLGQNYDSLPLQSLLSPEGEPSQPLVRKSLHEMEGNFSL